MSNTINSNEMMLSRFVSSLSCTWNSNNDNMEGAAGSAAEDINVRTISFPSFSMPDEGDHHQQQQQQQKQQQQQQRQSSSSSVSSLSGKEDTQSKISNLMSRKVLYEAAEPSESEENQDLYQHQIQQQQQPGRMMLENISESFGQLVDARIRAYAQILSNHVQVLRNSNKNNSNERGALIAEYKLRTLLEFASTSSDDDALFDSFTTKFKVISTSDSDDDDDIFSTTTATSTEKKEEKLLLRAAAIDDNDDDESSSENDNDNIDKAIDTTTLPIEMIVEIYSHRFREFGEKLIFKTTGKIHGKRFLIGSYDDTTFRDYICLSRDDHELYDSCHERNSASTTTTSTGCRHSMLRNNANSKNFNFAATAIAQAPTRLNEVFEKAQHNHNIDIDINCEELLSQMIEEAGKVVTMMVELTNLAWTNNTKKQDEIDNIIELNTMSPGANVIADDENDSRSVDIYIPPAPMAGSKRRRPRSDSLDDALMAPPRNVHIDVKHHRRHVSELPFHRRVFSTLPLLPVVSEEESVVDVTTSPSSSSSTTITTTTFTNLDVVHRDTERKCESRDFVSIDHSFEASTLTELDDEHHEDHHHHEEHEGKDALSPLPEEDSKNNNNDVDVDVEYYKIAAERACDIVDFVFAGEEIYKLTDVPRKATAVPSASSFSSKRLCVTK